MVMSYDVSYATAYALCCLLVGFFFKQKTAYEMRISDWSSDVCSSDLHGGLEERLPQRVRLAAREHARALGHGVGDVLLHLGHGLGVDQRADARAVLQAVAHRHGLHRSHQLLREGEIGRAHV